MAKPSNAQGSKKQPASQFGDNPISSFDVDLDNSTVGLDEWIKIFEGFSVDATPDERRDRDEALRRCGYVKLSERKRTTGPRKADKVNPVEAEMRRRLSEIRELLELQADVPTNQVLCSAARLLDSFDEFCHGGWFLLPPVQLHLQTLVDTLNVAVDSRLDASVAAALAKLVGKKGAFLHADLLVSTSSPEVGTEKDNLDGWKRLAHSLRYDHPLTLQNLDGRRFSRGGKSARELPLTRATLVKRKVSVKFKEAEGEADRESVFDPVLVSQVYQKLLENRVPLLRTALAAIRRTLFLGQHAGWLEEQHLEPLRDLLFAETRGVKSQLTDLDRVVVHTLHRIMKSVTEQQGGISPWAGESFGIVDAISAPPLADSPELRMHW
jgi:hypothetical protein